jgi:E-phenylitaconyl-CoA hydratase
VTDPALMIDRVGHVLVATINRPERLNALSLEVHEGLRATWRGLADDPDVRAVVITGAGERGFCTGMDLKDFAERGGPPSDHELVTDELQTTPLQCGSWVPTIVAVNGVCTGAGLHFVADADIVVASSRATFLDTHVSVGQVAALEPISLVPRIGLGNALRLSVLGRHGRIDAAEALRISLVDEVVEPNELLGRAVELAGLVATGSPGAIEASKRAIRASLDRPMAEAMQHGWNLAREFRSHPDNKEGPAAFAERREPRWR